jgi:hypothetical protein
MPFERKIKTQFHTTSLLTAVFSFPGTSGMLAQTVPGYFSPLILTQARFIFRASSSMMGLSQRIRPAPW